MDCIVLLPFLDFSRICRLCLAEADLTPFSDRICHLFMDLTNICVRPEECLPQNVCHDCVKKLEDISEFIEFSKLNDLKLRRILRNRTEYARRRGKDPVILKEDISVKDEDLGMPDCPRELQDTDPLDGWIGEVASEMEFDDSDVFLPEYVEMGDIQESINQSICNFEPSHDFSSSSTTLQDITSETVPTEDTEHIAGDAKWKLKTETEKIQFVSKKTLTVRLMRLKILKLKAKSVNFKSIGNSNNFVTIRMGTKSQRHISGGSLKSERNNSKITDETTVSVYSDMQSSHFCLFCEKEVSSFARHVVDYHSEEEEVKHILSHPVNSSERKSLMYFLGKKGDYLKQSEACCNPMRRPWSLNDVVSPCSHCIGYYEQLCRHVKMCSANPAIKKNVQADFQSFLFPHRNIDEDLKTKVFPRMRADHISMVTKKDNLICAYGAKFLKSHSVETHIVHVTSRKMRELARILIEINKMNPDIKSLREALQPRFYELIVKATKIIGKYDAALDTYECPSLAMSIGYVLKQCCDIAITMAHEKEDYHTELNTDEAISNFKAMNDLLENNWKEDVVNPVKNQSWQVK